MNATIHFTETMRGQCVLIKNLSRNEMIKSVEANAPNFPAVAGVEDALFVQQCLQQGLDDGQGFRMAWHDLAIAVVTQSKGAGSSLCGTIESGQIEIAAVAATPLNLKDGAFELFAEAGAGQRRMRYTLKCQSADGQNHYTAYGFKQVERPAKRWRLWMIWPDTTTLYVTVYQDEGMIGRETELPLMPDELICQAQSKLIAVGIIHIYPLAFARQLRTFKSTGVTGITAHTTNFWRFTRFFAGALIRTYFGHRQ